MGKKILGMIKQNNREVSANSAIPLIKKAGFDIKDNAQVLRNIYLN